MVLTQIQILLFCFLFPLVCRSLASWWHVCMEWTPSWRYGGGALLPAVRGRLRPGSTCELARHLVEKWRQGLSLRECRQTIRWTLGKPHCGQLPEMDVTSPSECYYIWVFQGRAISSSPHAFDVSSQHLSCAFRLPSHQIYLNFIATDELRGLIRHPAFSDT